MKEEDTPTDSTTTTTTTTTTTMIDRGGIPVMKENGGRCSGVGVGVGVGVVADRVVAVLVVVLAVMMMLCAGVGECYNVDTVTAVVHQGEPGSMFGFSVSQHIDQSTNWLLVGAPKAQTSQAGVEKGGAVFRCRTDRDMCQEIPFDPLGNNIRWNKTAYVETEDKSHQWFGATVVSSGENGVIVACAPRYVYFSATLDKREPVGSCIVNVASTTDYDVYAPCRNEKWGYHRQGSCQAGLSVAFSQGGKKLMIAAVGSWYWQGQLYNYNSRNNQQFVSTEEGPPEDDDSYMGYSSAVGDFDGDHVDDYVVGVPKGAGHLGKVAMFTQELMNIDNITGEQIGAYFGAALAVTDLNKDGLDDIIVGAPFHSDFSGMEFEVGRVYIFYQTPSHEFGSEQQDILDGKKHRGRFGMALTRLGDINYDGHQDIAVGAPFGGEDGRGAVYVYHGSNKGVITQPSQVIEAKDVAPGLSTFGSALAGGWDQDGNLYPDMIVGAYDSDRAVFLKARPVVQVFASLRIEPKDINLEQKSCSLMDDSRVSCMKVYSCLEYDGVGVPNELHFDTVLELDVLQRNLTVGEQRAFFTNNPGSFEENDTHKLTFKSVMCTTSYAYVINDLVDKLTPIAVEFKFKLREEPENQVISPHKRNPAPILDQYIPTSVRTEAQILKDCGDDNRCIPDLVLISFRITAAHIIGSGTDLEIMVIVENRKEDAFNTKLFVSLPPGVIFRNRAAVTSVVHVDCKTQNSTVVCKLGNPLPAGEKSSFTLRVSAQDTNETTDALKFYLKVNSSNDELHKDTANNEAEVEIPVTASADITIYGRSDPEQVNLNTTEVVQRNDNSYRVEHLYQLRNLGPSATKSIQLQILWPSHDHFGNPVLQITDKLQLNGTGSCNILIITPENATKYGYARPGNIHVVLPSDQDEFEDEERGDSVVLACSKRRCTVIQCLVGYLEANGNFIILIKSKLNVRSFVRRRDDAQVYHIRSSASARITSLPYKLATVNVTRFAVARKSIITTVNTDRLKPGKRKVEIWIIALAITAGILVLLLLVLLLWWCGFFKRRKLEDEGYMVSGVTSSNIIDNKIYE
ncbi:integrin alpha-8-like isoform X2 [Babylonia areolata]|uniref:integrin alpha-8-like isoform X2 n=1 Tax=Babylonia areolata TaxID=304850 RepID=UPI003FD0CD8D